MKTSEVRKMALPRVASANTMFKKKKAAVPVRATIELSS